MGLPWSISFNDMGGASSIQEGIGVTFLLQDVNSLFDDTMFY